MNKVCKGSMCKNKSLPLKEFIEKNKEYNNCNKCREYQREYRKNNRNKIREYYSNWDKRYQKSISNKIYYQKNRDIILFKNKIMTEEEYEIVDDSEAEL